MSKHGDHVQNGSRRLVVTPALDGLRLDRYFATVSTLSRRRCRELINNGLIVRNGDVTRVQSRLVKTGDVIDIAAPVDLQPQPALPEATLLHEDGWVVIADKPAGVLSQSGQDRGELAFDVMVLMNLARRDGRRPYLRLFHRLDRTTSGALLFAASPRATGPLERAWRNGRVDRRYLAVVEGHPTFDVTTLDGAIARDPGHAWRFRVADHGRSARTMVDVVALGTCDGRPWATTVCTLTSGRTHQVRVHLAAAGHPVLGDRLYGARPSTMASRPLLHAHSLTLPHPRDGSCLTATAPPPADLNPFLAGSRQSRVTY